MVKVILFDFWGTLVGNGVWSPIKQDYVFIHLICPRDQSLPPVCEISTPFVINEHTSLHEQLFNKLVSGSGNSKSINTANATHTHTHTHTHTQLRLIRPYEGLSGSVVLDMSLRK